jgi:hypothetical protein
MNGPTSVIADASGNVVIADQSDNRIRVVAAATGTFYGRAMTAHDIYTVAGNGNTGFSGDGGPATSAEFNRPWGWPSIAPATSRSPTPISARRSSTWGTTGSGS